MVFNIPRSTRCNQSSIHSSPRTGNSSTSLQDKRLGSHGPGLRAAAVGIAVVEEVVGILEEGSPALRDSN